MVTFIVGPEKREFKVHKDVMSSQCPVFSRMFSGSFKEGLLGPANLEEDQPEIFAVFFTWLYQNTISDATIKANSTLLFAFAEKYGIIRLMDNVMDLTRSYYSTSRQLYNKEMLALIYDNTHQASKLRLFGSRCVAKILLEQDGQAFGGVWSNEKLDELLGQQADLRLDLIKLLRLMSGKRSDDPRTAKACDYHQHGVGTACPYGGKSSR